MSTAAVAQSPTTERSPLAGTWTLVAADLLHPDGSRTRDYGAAPKGRLIVDAGGHYSLQIFKSERPRFAS
ncbi:MAG TPA: lipocalin-like domain-containing protein, partial [Gemmatimonadaceae bacterium]